MYVCIYVCIYVCMYVCMYVCVYVGTYVYMYICMHACMYMQLRACVVGECVLHVCIVHACVYAFITSYVHTRARHIRQHKTVRHARTDMYRQYMSVCLMFVHIFTGFFFSPLRHVSLSLSLSVSLSHLFSLSFSLEHARTHTHTHTNTHPLSLSHCGCFPQGCKIRQYVVRVRGPM